MGLISEGDTRTFKGEIENIGDADLIVDDLVIFENIEHNFNLPLIILPHDKFEFILTYDFTVPGDTSKIEFTVAVPRTLPDRQKIFIKK